MANSQGTLAKRVRKERTVEWEERVCAVDEAAVMFRAAGRAGKCVQGWLRMVRLAVGIPAEKIAGRMGVSASSLRSMEKGEMRGGIELGTLRRAAEALGCELVYGLAPKKGTLAEMAADEEAARAQRALQLHERDLERRRDRKRAVRVASWKEKQRAVVAAARWAWAEAQMGDLTPLERLRMAKPVGEKSYVREVMRKAIRKMLREKGIRLR
jgi:predicted DNA-binding mobile mystery protein A